MGGLENVSSEFIVAGVTGPSKMELQWKSELCPHEHQGAGPGGAERMSIAEGQVACSRLDTFPVCPHSHYLGLLSDILSSNLKHWVSSLSQ